MPKVSIHAVQAALEANKNPHHKPDSTFFEVPNRIRASIAKLIRGKPEEIALTSGASAGVAAVEKERAAPDVDRELVARGEIVVEADEQQLLDLRVAIRRRVVLRA